MALTQMQYDEIMRGYERKRDISHRNALEARRKVREAIPEYKDTEDAVTALAMECAEKVLDGDAGALKDIRSRMEEMVRKQKKLLTDNGFAEDCLEEKYECSLCRDTGYTPDGKKCSCLKRQILSLLYHQSNIEEILDRENFSTLRLDIYTDSEREKMEPIIRKCRSFADSFGSSYENILLYGNVGVGKTFLTNCMAKAVLDSGYSVIYFTSIRLFDTLSRELFGHDEERSWECQKDIFTCDLLIIDDLGTETVSSFVAGRLFDILNERDLRRRSTIISTNLSFEELGKRYSERNFSRIFGNYTILHPDAEDIRIRKKRSAF
ncbi:MAG: ATP-binding protein [Lachnospiraceae bacterium]|nr:ATP-binding protein [Lachnospiraceae bacterium]